jgi:hypothetical protein
MPTLPSRPTIEAARSIFRPAGNVSGTAVEHLPQRALLAPPDLGDGSATSEASAR